MQRTVRTLLLGLTATVMFGAWAPAAEAGAIIGDCYTGDCGSLTGQILVDIVNDAQNQNDGSGDVRIVLQNLTNGFIDEIGLRYTGGLSGNPKIESFGTLGSATAPKLTLGSCQNDNSNQALNVCFDFASKNSERFNAGDTVTFFVDSTSVDFIAALFDPSGGFAHVQGLPAGGSAKLVDSPPPSGGGFNEVPEPSSMLLLASGFAAVAAARRRNRRQSGTRRDDVV